MTKRFSHSIQDEYYTPLYAVNIITPFIEQFKTIWCPFDQEDSGYVTRLRGLGHIVHSTHIDNGEDFLTYTPKFEYDAIISNPPFSLKNEVLDKCIRLNKPFALLLPFAMFNSISAVSILSKSNPNFIIMDRRISFNGERPNFTCWYVTSGIIKQNFFHIFKDDPKVLYRKDDESV